MTVLETEEDADKRSVPPRKKFCLSLSGCGRAISIVVPQPPPTSTRGGLLDSTDFSFSTSKMLNGYRNQLSNHQDGNYDVSGTNGEGLKIATLCNLGNTCFLNSVLYTLRFAPSFLHNLHHLATDLSNLNEKQLQAKAKSSSLGRTGVSLTSSSSRSWSSKDLTLAGSTTEASKPRIQIATEKLHELFMALRASEVRENSEPYQPDAFLQALREVNPIFEGNQQQDAHELLVCLLDNIRETFQLLVRHRESQFGQSNGGFPEFATNHSTTETQSENSGSGKRSIRKSRKKKKITSRGSSVSLAQPNANGTVGSARLYENGHAEFAESNGEIGMRKPESKKCFISEDFEGVSLLRTTCLECEHVTERKETFCDICVPIDIDRSNEKDDDGELVDSSEVYKRAVVTSELLWGRDKYWCARCLRYNEARRAVCFPSLPRLLILQLKRFSTAAGSMEKINNHMPTPLTLQCFCEECSNDETHGTAAGGSTEARHVYKLYSVIMHQGATMTAGHYVAYTRLPDEPAYAEYSQCDRDNKRQNSNQTSSVSTSSSSSSSSTSSDKTSSILYFRSKLFRSKTSATENKEQVVNRVGCRSMDCCGIWRNKQGATWLECDDEAVHVIPLRELEDKLAPNARNSATPYLLFYVRSTT